MELKARRVFRFALVTALSATIAFALQLTFSLLPPVLAILFALNPAPPLKLKQVLALALLIVLTTGVGLLLVPVLMFHGATALLLVALGLYVSAYLTVNKQQAALGMFLATGFILISALGLASTDMARSMVLSMAGGTLIVILVQWLVYPFFPEDPSTESSAPPAAHTSTPTSNWIALRSTLVVFPVYIAALSNPMMWMATLTKTLTIAQQRSSRDVWAAGVELVGSTFLGGCLAVLFWVLLSLFPHLWVIFLLALLLGIWSGAKLYGLTPTQFTPSFWSNTLMTLWIMLAPAVADSANGNDVYHAFFQRFTLFIIVTFYAWLALILLETWRDKRKPAITT